MNEVIVALVSIIGGGGGLKLLEIWLGRGDRKIDEKQQFINDLKEEVASQKAENKAFREEIDRLEDREDELRLKAQDLYFKGERWKLNIAHVLESKGIKWDEIPGLFDE